MTTFNFELIRAYVIEEIKDFNPNPDHVGNETAEINDFETFMNKLANKLQGIFCKINRVDYLKQLIGDYEKDVDELKKILPDYCF